MVFSLTAISRYIEDFELYERTDRKKLPLVEFAHAIVQSDFFQFFIIAIVIGNAIAVGDEARVISSQTDIGSPRSMTNLILCMRNLLVIGGIRIMHLIFVVMAFTVFQWIVLMVVFDMEMEWIRVFLLRTLRRNAVDILILLLLTMFIFGVLGHYLFGQVETNTAYQDWGTLGNAFMTLFIYVCGDGWVPYHERLDNEGYAGSEMFSAVFFLLGTLLLRISTEVDKAEKLRKRKIAKMIKRELFLRKQRQDMSQLVAQTFNTNRNFQELLKELVGTLRHEDVVPMTHIACNLTWLETFVVTLTHQENTMYRCQQLHFAIANVLAEYVDRRLKSRMKQDR
ncbi:hypothetical protein BC829DRAFT_405939 [Chytridium lagenaria]|nr:hypothetical protein BC829DRAFT_405939 [Chytridium lagenaria]